MHWHVTAARARRKHLAIALVAVVAPVLATVAGASGGVTVADRHRAAPPAVPVATVAAVVPDVAVTSPPTPAPAGAPPPAPAAPVVPPFDRLPAGPAPTTVPYAIGARVYFSGRSTDLTASMPGVPLARRHLTTAVGADGLAWVQLPQSGPDVVGRLDGSGAFTRVQGRVTGTSRLAVTTRGFVALPGSGQAVGTDGDLVAAFTGSPAIDCGECTAAAVGARLVVDQWVGSPDRPEHQGTWLWYPPATVQRVDDRFAAVGRLGAGWLGLRLPGGCWRVAPVADPARLGATACSLVTPLVSADGRRAVVVQDGRLRVLDPVTGATVSVAAMGAVPGWSPAGARYAVPAAWETADAYLVTARVDDALALVRCSASTGACQRVVRATVRAGVDRIVTERGTDDAIAAG